MPEYPTGTVTFLFTDIEGSTSRWEKNPNVMQHAFKQQEQIIRDAVARHNGYAYKMIGDAFQIAFAIARDALDAAIDAQRTLRTEDWGDIGEVRVRMALHTGVAEERGDDYVGPVLNRAARLMSSGHGGQILISEATQALVRDNLPFNVSLRDLGEKRLRDLARAEHIYQVVASDLQSDFPPLKTLDAFLNNLPIQLTSFVGREKEIQETKRLIAVTRLLTLTGAGGTGKTRLALQVAAESLENFRDGIWFVELAPLADPALVAQGVATILGLQEREGASLETILKDYLRAKNLLIILDNCEHLIAACAQFADTFLHSCPHIKIIASSREALGVAGETTYRVPSLTCPDLKQNANLEPIISNPTQFDAVRLFVDRAMMMKPSFAITPQNARAIAQICQRLDGIPLALELAASRVQALRVEDVAKRLDDRFRLLTGGSRTALPRQQTLRAAVDWSYDLLSEPERVLLRRLSVFAGGWSLEAAETVCSMQKAEGSEQNLLPTADRLLPTDILDLLSRLVAKSLILLDEQAEETRYRMLETIRQYAHERLLHSGESEQVRDRHLDFFLKFAEDAEPKLNGAEQATWLNQLEMEHDNLRFALEWSLSEDKIEKGMRMVGALRSFWTTRGYWSEAYPRILGILKVPGAEKRTLMRGRALHAAAQTARNFQDSRLLYEESIEVLREVGATARQALESVIASYANALFYHDIPGARIWAEKAARLSRESANLHALGSVLNAQGYIALWTGDFASARNFFEESVAKNREIGNQNAYATSLGNLGITHAYQLDFEKAQECLDKSLAVARELGSLMTMWVAMYSLGNLARSRGQYDVAESWLNQVFVESRELGHKTIVARALMYLGRLQLTKDNRTLAEQHARECLSLVRETDNQVWIAFSLESLAFLASASNKSNRAVRLFGAAEAQRERLGTPLWPIERAEYEPYLAATRAQLDEASFTAAWNEGRAMTIEQAIEYALDTIYD